MAVKGQPCESSVMCLHDIGTLVLWCPNTGGWIESDMSVKRRATRRKLHLRQILEYLHSDEGHRKESGGLSGRHDLYNLAC